MSKMRDNKIHQEQQQKRTASWRSIRKKGTEREISWDGERKQSADEKKKIRI